MNRCRNCVALLSLIALAFALAGTQHADGGGKAANKLKFEIYKDKASEFRWRLLAGDTPMAVSGQGYSTKQSCKEGVESVKTNGASDKARFEIYEDKGKEFRWRLLATNGNNIASSNSSFATKGEAEAAIATLKKGLPSATVEEAK